MLLTNENKKRDNSKKELEKVSEEYYMPIYKYCNIRLESGKSYSYDITNEVFVLLCEKWDSLRKENIRAWLYRTADNMIKEFLRKHRTQMKKIKYIEDLDDYTADNLTYEQNFDDTDDKSNDEDTEIYKNEILNALSDEEKELFHMFYTKKLSYEEICGKLNISKENLKKRLYRFRKKITDAVYIKFNK